MSTLTIAHQSYNTDREELEIAGVEAGLQGRQKRQDRLCKDTDNRRLKQKLINSENTSSFGRDCCHFTAGG